MKIVSSAIMPLAPFEEPDSSACSWRTPEIEIANVNNQLPMLNHWLSELNPGQVSMILMHLTGMMDKKDSQGAKAYAYLNVTVNPLPKVSISVSSSTTDTGLPVVIFGILDIFRPGRIRLQYIACIFYFRANHL